MNTTAAKFNIIGISLIIMGLMVTNVSYGQHRLLGNAVAMWIFEEREDGVFVDISGNGHDATLVNSPKLVDGKFGNGVEFSEVRKSYLEVVDSEALHLTDVIAITAWVKRPLRENANDTAPYFILEKGGEWQHNRATYGISLHKIFSNMFYFWYQGGFQGVTGIRDDGWHHYVAVAKNDDRDAALYIDGELKPIEHTDGARKIQLLPSPGNALHMGALIPERFDSYSDNIIDDVAIFNKVLTQGDVARLLKGLEVGILSVSPSGNLATTWAAIKRKPVR